MKISDQYNPHRHRREGKVERFLRGLTGSMTDQEISRRIRVDYAATSYSIMVFRLDYGEKPGRRKNSSLGTAERVKI